MSLDPYRNRFTQLLLALFGSVALLIGAAMHSQRTSQAALQRQNADLAHANHDLDRLGIELRKAAQRNVHMEEEQARRRAAEIHDEPGQNLMVLHARLKLAQNLLDAGQRSDVTASIVDILVTMCRLVHGLMDSLRPPSLDEFSLVRALADWPPHNMVERARHTLRLHLRRRTGTRRRVA